MAIMPHGFERCERGWNKDVEQRKGERNKGKCRLELTVAAALTALEMIKHRLLHIMRNKSFLKSIRNGISRVHRCS